MTWTGRFLGAAETIGRLGFVLESGQSKFLFDYGMEPDKPPQYPLPCPPIDRAFLTHAHLDHSGMIPWLASRYDAQITATPVTAEVATLMHRDSLKIARLENFPEPYSDQDIETTKGLYDLRPFRERAQLGDHDITLLSAGHIPGAAQMQLKGPNGTLVFTGDLYTREQRLVMASDTPRCDVLFMESTYAGREHEPRDEVEQAFLEFAEEVVSRGGILIVPAFAVGRAQEIAMVLADRGFQVWLDGMGRAVADILRNHPDYLRDPQEFSHALGQCKFVRNHRGRSFALREADVIITTGGMLDGGPVLWYLDHLRNDPKSGVALTGYQVEGSNGRRLKETGELDFDNKAPGTKVHKVNCELRHFNFSAHAGHTDLVAFAKATRAKDIVLFHGDKREELLGDLSDFATVHLPKLDETFVLK